MKTATVEIVAGPVGLSRLLINGQDLSAEVSGVQVNVTDGQPTEVFIRQPPGAEDLQITGDGIVYISGGSGGVKEFLAKVNPAALEERAMEGLGYGEDNVVSAVLAVLTEMADGH